MSTIIRLRANKEFLEKLQTPVELLTDTVFAYVSDTKTPQGILAIVKRLNYTMNDLMQVKNQKAPHLVVLDNLQDPGNLGTIFRTAEAAGVTGILLSKDCVDVYNPKVIRSTMGAVFRMPFLYVEDLPEKIKELQKESIKTYAAHLRGENAYDEEDYTTGCAFLIGNEGNGLRDEVADCADCLIRIPMEGEAESLNAAVAQTVAQWNVLQWLQLPRSPGIPHASQRPPALRACPQTRVYTGKLSSLKRISLR